MKARQFGHILRLSTYFHCTIGALTTPQVYTLPPAKLIQAVEFARARHILYFSSVAWAAAVLLTLILLRFVPRMRRRNSVLIITAVWLVVTAANLAPEAAGHWLSLKYRISIEPWGPWFADWSKAAAIGYIITVLLVSGLYFLLRRSPRRWWLWAWMACIPLIVGTALMEPYIVEPLFNHFEPLAKMHPELIAPIERILTRAGVTVPRDRLFEMRASDKTNALNAYVSGFGPSRRVVLYDTIIRAEPEPALLTTFGHELGHYVLDHVALGIGFGIIILLIAFAIAAVLIRWMVRRWGTRLDIRAVDDWATLPVFGLIAVILSFIGDPVGNAFSRRIEHNADVYSLEVTHGIVPDNTRADAEAFQIEGETDLDPPDPNRFIVFWLYSHPPTADRLRFALDWKPGRAPRYVK